jgi:peptidoglycan/xylan/chitin deacetylase (PgdA/CDA1 family)
LVAGLSFSVTSYSPRRFERLLQGLVKAGFNFAVPVQSELQPEGRGVVISFDDGYQHLYDYLPDLMSRYKFQPIIFVPAAYIGRSNRWDYTHALRPLRHLSKDSIRNLSKLNVVFGSHGHSHCDLTACTPEKLRAELVESRKILEDITGRDVVRVSYPFGRCNQRVLEAAEEAGYRNGYTMRFPTVQDQHLALGRYAVYGFDTDYTVRQKLAGGPLYPLERATAGFINSLSRGTIILNRWRRLDRE